MLTKRNSCRVWGYYNAFTTNEVAVVIVNLECVKCNIVNCARNGRLHQTSETHWAPLYTELRVLMLEEN